MKHSLLSGSRPHPDLGINGRPDLVFQPAVDLATGRLLGFEALLRWTDRTGAVAPQVIIERAEAQGTMAALNRWVLTEACAAAVGWVADVQLAVNCSVYQLRRQEAADAAIEALELTGLNPDRLTIEVRETAVDDPDAARELLAMARLGIQLTVDDVGPEHAALDRLSATAVRTLKIDGGLVGQLGQQDDGPARAAITSIIDLSRSVGMSTVAEGVETAVQVATLRELGADAAQGYFFASPLSAAAAHELAGHEPPPIFSLTERTTTSTGRRRRVSAPPRGPVVAPPAVDPHAASGTQSRSAAGDLQSPADDDAAPAAPGGSREVFLRREPRSGWWRRSL